MTRKSGVIVLVLVALAAGGATLWAVRNRTENLANPPIQGAMRDFTVSRDRPPAPAGTLIDADGKETSLAALEGRIVVANFWATWCAPCRVELPMLEGAFRAYSPYGFQVLAVDTEDSVPEKTLRQLAAQLTIPLVRRMKGPYADFGAVPTTYVIDRSGKLVYAKVGSLDLETLNAIVVPLLREPVPTPPEPSEAAAKPSPEGGP